MAHLIAGLHHADQPRDKIFAVGVGTALVAFGLNAAASAAKGIVLAVRILGALRRLATTLLANFVACAIAIERAGGPGFAAAGNADFAVATVEMTRAVRGNTAVFGADLAALAVVIAGAEVLAGNAETFAAILIDSAIVVGAAVRISTGSLTADLVPGAVGPGDTD